MVIAIARKEFYRFTCLSNIFIILRITDIVPVLIYFFKNSEALYQNPVFHFSSFLGSFKIFIRSFYSKISYKRILIIDSFYNFEIGPQRPTAGKNNILF